MMQKIAPHLIAAVPELKFECIFCGKMLQFGNRTCQHCERPAPGWNRRGVYWKINTALGGILALGLWGLSSVF